MEGATTRLWVATPVDLHHVGVDRFCDCLIRGILGARPGFVIANARDLSLGPSGDGGRSPPLLGGQAGHIGNRVSAQPIFDCSFNALRAELERNKVSSVETSTDAAFAAKFRYAGP